MASTFRWMCLAYLSILSPISLPATLDKVPQDFRNLRALTTWQVSEPRQNNTPDQVCNIANMDRYEPIRMQHDLGSNIDDRSATQQIQRLDRKVVAYLRERRWSTMNVGPNRGEIPNVKRCYQKQGTIVQIYQTTGRCTMNTPCRAYDGFAITFYLSRTH